ncbi:MAG: DUF4981 domain-containing protein [Victivallales bacterium]|nr:DUF4981 domain-containing protein [Victivallales bacterium]
MLLENLLWQSPSAISAGTLPVRATSFSFDNEKDALEAAGTQDHGTYCLSLNGIWKFHYLEKPDCLTDAELDAECATWNDIKVPCPWTMQGYDRPHYTNVQMPYPQMPPHVPAQNPTGIYRRSFSLPKSWKKRRVILHFDGVESCFALRVNGKDAGFAKDSRGAIEFDITDFCREGSNELAIVAIKWSDANFIEDQDMWWHGGIVKDVMLLSRPETHISDVFASTTLDEDCRKGVLKVQGSVRFEVPAEASKNWRFRVRLYAPNGKLLRGFPRECSAAGYRVDDAPASPLVPDDMVQCTLPNVKAWSAEHPVLYKLSVALVNLDGQEVEYTAYRVGFRRVEIKDRKLLINGEPVEIHGVNRHESNPRTGRSVTREDMERDLKMMKRFNINAIRTSHYPDAPEFYDLCDEYGFYVWDEANLEHHAFYRSLCRNPEWAPVFTERATRLLERDKNHPSILVWSLGNESGHGPNQAAMAGYIRHRDPSRLIHYEGAIYSPNHETVPGKNMFLTDIVGPMYPPVEKLREWSLIAINDPRPYIMCEYSHAMGNSNGELKDYFEVFESCEGIQGGFIWEWCDHSLYQKTPDGKEYLAYGGDFGDAPNDGNFVCDGLVGAERDVHPALYEYKYLSQPVRFKALDQENYVFELENKQYFSDFIAFILQYDFLVDGNVISSRKMPLPKVAPRFGTKAQIKLVTPDFSRYHGKAAHVTMRLLLRHQQPYADAGFEVAHEQFALPVRLTPAKVSRIRATCAIEETDNALVLKTEQLSMEIQRSTGSVNCQMDKVLLDGPEPYFFRAPIDNDGFKVPRLTLRKWALDSWRKLGYDHTETRLASLVAKDKTIIMERLITAPGIPGTSIRHIMRVTALCDGRIKVENCFKIPREYKDLPRVGLRFRLPLALDTAEYIGLGPHENYRDRNASTLFGHYIVPFSELPGHYVMPQSAGNRTGVQKLTLRGKTASIIIEAENAPVEFSVLPYSDEEIFGARHWHELGKQKHWHLHLDAIQRGIGTSSCGPFLNERYFVPTGTFHLDFTIEL